MTAHVHPTAYVAETVDLGHGTIVGPLASIIGPTRIGRMCVIGPGARIGNPGFGYERGPDDRWQPKPQNHGVVIEDDVHVGANTCIDRGSYRDTRIGAGTRIDNLVHIAHNVQIGKRCLVIAQAMLAGSVELGDDVHVAPCASVREHTEVGRGALLGLGAVVVKPVVAGDTVTGVPARPMPEREIPTSPEPILDRPPGEPPEVVEITGLVPDEDRSS
jgi:UDP-3-O-[3-hydroxymyristoyl] glucosamine N-acyltransferase